MLEQIPVDTYLQRFNLPAGTVHEDIKSLPSMQKHIIEDFKQLNEEIAEKLALRQNEPAPVWRTIGQSSDRIHLAAETIGAERIDMYVHVNGQRYRVEDQEYETAFKTLAIRYCSLALNAIQANQFTSKDQFASSLDASLKSTETLSPFLNREEIIDSTDPGLAAVALAAKTQYDPVSKRLNIYLPPETVIAKYQEADIPLAGAIEAAGQQLMERRYGRIVGDWETIINSAGSTIRQFEWLMERVLAGLDDLWSGA
jgi:hypothetical protein